MKKILAIAFAVVVVAVAIWTASWLLGRSKIETGIEDQLARADTQGWSVTIGERSIRGFPSAYVIEMTDVAAVRRADGLLIRLPSLVMDWSPDEAGRVEARLPDTFSVQMPVPEAVRLADEALPPMLRLDGEAEAAALFVVGPGTDTRSFDFSASKFILRLDQEDFAGRVALELSGLDGHAAAGAADKAAITADNLELRIANTPDQGAKGELDLALAGLSLDGSASPAEREALWETLFGGRPGGAELAWTISDGDASVVLTDTPDGSDGRFEWAGRGMTGLATLTPGAVEVTAESTGSELASAPGDAANPLRGRIRAEQSKFYLRMPTAPDAMPGQGALRLGWEGVTADDVLWGYFDPGKALDRSPISLELDTEITMRLTRRIDRGRPGDAPPFEPSNLIVNRVAVQALGATAETSGDIEFVQPVMLPVGELAGRAEGLSGLIASLERAGLIDGEIREIATAMLQVYARPSDGDDSWQTEVGFTEGGVTVNGLPVQ